MFVERRTGYKMAILDFELRNCERAKKNVQTNAHFANCESNRVLVFCVSSCCVFFDCSGVV